MPLGKDKRLPMDMKATEKSNRVFNFKLSEKEAFALKMCLGKQSVGERKRWGVSEKHALIMRDLHHALSDALKNKEDGT